MREWIHAGVQSCLGEGEGEAQNSGGAAAELNCWGDRCGPGERQRRLSALGSPPALSRALRVDPVSHGGHPPSRIISSHPAHLCPWWPLHQSLPFPPASSPWLTCIHGGLPLPLVEVGRHRDDGLADGAASVQLSIGEELAQDLIQVRGRLESESACGKGGSMCSSQLCPTPPSRRAPAPPPPPGTGSRARQRSTAESPPPPRLDPAACWAQEA